MTILIPTRYAAPSNSLPSGGGGGGPGGRSAGPSGRSGGTSVFGPDSFESAGAAAAAGSFTGAGMTMVNVEHAEFHDGIDLQELAAEVRLGLVLSGAG